MSELMRIPVGPYRGVIFDLSRHENVEGIISDILVRFYTEKPTFAPLSVLVTELVKDKLWVFAAPDLVVESPAVDNRAEVMQ